MRLNPLLKRLVAGKRLWLNGGLGLLVGFAIAIGWPLIAQATTTAKSGYNTPFWIESIGIVAGFGTTFAALPDCIEMCKRRSTKGMNPRMCAITGTFQTLWLVYGFLIYAPPVIFWNAIAIITNALTVSAYLYFYRQEQQQRQSKPYNDQ